MAGGAAAGAAGAVAAGGGTACSITTTADRNCGSRTRRCWSGGRNDLNFNGHDGWMDDSWKWDNNVGCFRIIGYRALAFFVSAAVVLGILVEWIADVALLTLPVACVTSFLGLCVFC